MHLETENVQNWRLAVLDWAQRVQVEYSRQSVIWILVLCDDLAVIFIDCYFEAILCITIIVVVVVVWRRKAALNSRSISAFKTQLKAHWLSCVCGLLQVFFFSKVFMTPPHNFPLWCLLNIIWNFYFPSKCQNSQFMDDNTTFKTRRFAHAKVMQAAYVRTDKCPDNQRATKIF